MWRSPAPGLASLEALVRWAQPSVPSPLPGSRPFGTHSYLVGTKADAVVAAYRDATPALGGLVPAGAQVEPGPEGSVLVRCRQRTSGVFASTTPHGTRYTIAPSPPLVVEGGSGIPNGRFWVRTRPVPNPLAPDAPSLLCQLSWRDQSWIVMVASQQDDNGAGPTRALLAKGTWADFRDEDATESAPWLEGEVTAGDDGIARGVFGSGPKAVRIRWFHTDELDPTFMATVAPAGEIRLAKEKGLAKRRVIVETEGLPAGTSLVFSFDGRELRRAKADDEGEARVQLTIPPDTPPGLHKVTVAAGDRVVELDYRVLPPR